MDSDKGEATEPALRILTWNVGKDEKRRDLALAAIARIDADIVFLQEPTSDWQKHLHRWLKKRYTHTDFHIRKERSGSGLSWFSKLPMNKGEFITSPAGWHGGWIKKFETPLGRVQVLGVHLRPSMNDKERFTIRAFFTAGKHRVDEIREYMKHVKSDLPLIVLGDFNATDNSRSVKYVAQHGLKNALCQVKCRVRTYRAALGPLGISVRLDHIFFTPDLTCRQAEVIRVQPSDHQPVIAEFSANGKQQKAL